MDIEKAKKILEKFTTEHKLFNIKHSDGLEEAIKTLLTAYKKEKEKVDSRENVIMDEEKEITKLNNEIYELKKRIHAINLISYEEE